MKSDKLSTIALLLVFLVGLSLLLYPTISNYWNTYFQSKAITDYSEQVADLDNEKYDQMLQDAHEYNKRLYAKGEFREMTAKEREEYISLLNLSGDGIMGYVEIPSIRCSLPIYHGTDDAILQVAIGHIESSSLPVGGPSTHSVISGHRGLPSAKLFTRIDQLQEGDIFMIRVLDELMTYEVDKISIVKPHEVKMLSIEKGQDYCTLVTCTPYGINTHRLLVRGHRVENQYWTNSIRVTADATQIDPMIVAAVTGIVMLIILLVVVLIKTRDRQ